MDEITLEELPLYRDFITEESYELLEEELKERESFSS